MPLSGRWAKTGLATCVILSLSQIGLPGVDLEAARAARIPTGGLHVAAIGIMPYLSAVLMVEIAAVLVSRWQSYRHGDPEGRARLTRWSRTLTLGLAVFQAFGIAQWLDGLQPNDVFTGGTNAKLLVVATITAATAIHIAVADWVTRQRTVNGIVWLSVVGLVPTFWQEIRTLLGLAPGAAGSWSTSSSTTQLVTREAVLVVAVIGATLLALRRGPAQAMASTAGSEREAPALAIPASSIGPLGLLGFPATLAGLGVFGAEAVRRRLEQSPFSLDALGLLVVASVVATLVLHRAGALAEVYLRLEAEPTPEIREAWRAACARAIRAALPATALYVLVLGVALRQSALSLGGVALCTAFVLDIIASVRAERSLPDAVIVWEELRLVALPVARTALERAGIRSEVVGANVLTLLQAAAPYAAASLLVSAKDEAEARTLLAAVLGPEPLRADARGDAYRDAPRPPIAARQAPSVVRFAPLFGILLVVGPFLTLLPMESPSAPRTTPRPKLEVVRVNDDADPLRGVSASAMPDDVHGNVYNEIPPRGDRAPEKVVFAAFDRLGDSRPVVTERVAPWLGSFPLPPNTRFALGDFDRGVPGGQLRTYLLDGPAEITTIDVVDARVQSVGDPPELAVLIQLTPAAGQRLAKLTTEHRNRRLALVLDGYVRAAPRVLGPTTGGTLSIYLGQGDDAASEAKALAEALRP